MLKAEANEEIFIDFSKIEFIYPSGIILLVTLGKYLHLTKSCKIKQNFPSDLEVKNFLSESGFSKSVGINLPVDPNIFPHNGAYIYEMKNFSWPDDYEIERVIDVIEKELKLSEKIRLDVHENLVELILNVEQHSKSPIHCYVMGQGYPTTHRIRFCIGDIGMGIKNHLGSKYKELLEKPSTAAIEMALRETITGTRGNTNSGVGLSNFRNFVHLCGGTFVIISGKGFYEETVSSFKRPIINRMELDFEFPGTIIDVTINSKPGWKIFSKKEVIPKEYRLIN